jgi:hypothetical protein
MPHRMSRRISDRLTCSRMAASCSVKLAEPESASGNNITVRAQDSVHSATANGNGPFHALHLCLRKCLSTVYPQMAGVRLTDYKVRVLEPRKGTAAKVRVRIEWPWSRLTTWRGGSLSCPTGSRPLGIQIDAGGLIGGDAEVEGDGHAHSCVARWGGKGKLAQDISMARITAAFRLQSAGRLVGGSTRRYLQITKRGGLVREILSRPRRSAEACSTRPNFRDGREASTGRVGRRCRGIE